MNVKNDEVGFMRSFKEGESVSKWVCNKENMQGLNSLKCTRDCMLKTVYMKVVLTCCVVTCVGGQSMFPTYS